MIGLYSGLREKYECNDQRMTMICLLCNCQQQTPQNCTFIEVMKPKGWFFLCRADTHLKGRIETGSFML